jgi:hypothetical protein
LKGFDDEELLTYSVGGFKARFRRSSRQASTSQKEHSYIPLPFGPAKVSSVAVKSTATIVGSKRSTVHTGNFLLLLMELVFSIVVMYF